MFLGTAAESCRLPGAHGGFTQIWLVVSFWSQQSGLDFLSLLGCDFLPPIFCLSPALSVTQHYDSWDFMCFRKKPWMQTMQLCNANIITFLLRLPFTLTLLFVFNHWWLFVSLADITLFIYCFFGLLLPVSPYFCHVPFLKPSCNKGRVKTSSPRPVHPFKQECILSNWNIFYFLGKFNFFELQFWDSSSKKMMVVVIELGDGGEGGPPRDQPFDFHSRALYLLQNNFLCSTRL